MPEFILDHGSIDGLKLFKSLDSFTQGYLEAMFFTSTGNPEDEALHHATVAELAPSTIEDIKVDCADFQRCYGADIDEAIDQDKANYDLEAAGRDFWYTRNGHGYGYWDRGLGDIGDTLAELARSYRGVDLYRGDDGLLYLACQRDY